MYIIHYSSNKNIGYVWMGINANLSTKNSTAHGTAPPPRFEIPGSAPSLVLLPVWLKDISARGWNVSIKNLFPTFFLLLFFFGGGWGVERYYIYIYLSTFHNINHFMLTEIKQPLRFSTETCRSLITMIDVSFGNVIGEQYGTVKIYITSSRSAISLNRTVLWCLTPDSEKQNGWSKLWRNFKDVEGGQRLHCTYHMMQKDFFKIKEIL